MPKASNFSPFLLWWAGVFCHFLRNEKIKSFNHISNCYLLESKTVLLSSHFEREKLQKSIRRNLFHFQWGELLLSWQSLRIKLRELSQKMIHWILKAYLTKDDPSNQNHAFCFIFWIGLLKPLQLQTFTIMIVVPRHKGTLWPFLLSSVSSSKAAVASALGALRCATILAKAV